MTSRALINPLPKKSGVTLRATIQNPRPRKYASDADRQKAFRERQAMIQVRVAPKAVETFDEIAETLGYSRQEVVYALLMKGLMSLGNWETVGLPIDWQKKMPQFKLPKYEENPIMRKATPAQIAARERFAAMARSGAFKRKAKKSREPQPHLISAYGESELARVYKNDSVLQKIQASLRKIEDEYPIKRTYGSDNLFDVIETRGKDIDKLYNDLLNKSNERATEINNALMRKIKAKRNPAKKRSVYTGPGPGDKTVYKRYTIIHPTSGDWFYIVRDGVNIGSARSVQEAKSLIDMLTEGLPNPRKRNPAEAKERKSRVVLITNPKSRDAAKYAYALVLDDGGFTYGMDARTPVTFEFSQRDRKRGVYTSYALPSAAVLNPDFQAMVKSLPGQQFIGTLTELRSLVKKFV